MPAIAVACSADDRAGSSHTELANHAFDLEVIFSQESDLHGCAAPDLLPLSLHVLSANSAHMEAVLGSKGDAQPAAFDWNGSAWRLAAPVSHGGGQGTLSEAVLSFTQSADGSVHLAGSAIESSSFIVSDVHCDIHAQVLVSGGPLSREPKWIGGDHVANPLRPTVVSLDTPLGADAVASLVPASDAAIALAAMKTNDWVVRFTATRILPLGMTATLTSPSPAIGTTLTPGSKTLKTAADPGLATGADFEGMTMPISITGDTTMAVASYLGLPAISGSRSLKVQNGEALLHLARPAGTKAVVLRARNIAGPPSVCVGATFTLMVGVVNGTKRTQVVVPSGDGDALTSPNSTVTFTSGVVREVRLPLEEVGSDLILSIEQRSGGEIFNSAACEPAAGLVDDVHIE